METDRLGSMSLWIILNSAGKLLDTGPGCPTPLRKKHSEWAYSTLLSQYSICKIHEMTSCWTSAREDALHCIISRPASVSSSYSQTLGDQYFLMRTEAQTIKSLQRKQCNKALLCSFNRIRFGWHTLSAFIQRDALYIRGLCLQFPGKETVLYFYFSNHMWLLFSDRVFLCSLSLGI